MHRSGAWTVEQLQGLGMRPGILMRGYRADDLERNGSAGGDEGRLLRDRLGVPVVEEPDRVLGAETLRREHPDPEGRRCGPNMAQKPTTTPREPRER